MLSLNLSSMQDKEAWNKRKITCPSYSVTDMQIQTRQNPQWLHFGAGNIFRGYIAPIQQRLLEKKKTTTGIIAAEAYDEDKIKSIYWPYDNLCLLLSFHSNGMIEKEIIASVADAYLATDSSQDDWAALMGIVKSPSLQMISFTVTELGYEPRILSHSSYPEDIHESMMTKITALLYERFLYDANPIALVSMDNCLQNGELLRQGIATVAEIWVEQDDINAAFLDYLSDPEKVSYPLTVIDKMTPKRPTSAQQAVLESSGLTDMGIVKTGKHTFVAPFVNAESGSYLVIQNHFPNGRPPLESAGVYITDKRTVERVERMKSSTCLVPLHTALAIFGCLLGYQTIYEEMADLDLKDLVSGIAYQEGMPVVVNPGILDPTEYVHEVLTERFPHPYVPDSPQRVACDTSQKLAVCFGETIKAYMNEPHLDPNQLTLIPLTLAAWVRYLLAVDNNGNTMALSPDPLLPSLLEKVKHLRWDSPSSVRNLELVWSDASLFGVNLYEVGLAEKVEAFLKQMLAGKGAVRKTLHETVTLSQKKQKKLRGK